MILLPQKLAHYHCGTHALTNHHCTPTSRPSLQAHPLPSHHCRHTHLLTITAGTPTSQPSLQAHPPPSHHCRHTHLPAITAGTHTSQQPLQAHTPPNNHCRHTPPSHHCRHTPPNNHTEHVNIVPQDEYSVWGMYDEQEIKWCVAQNELERVTVQTALPVTACVPEVGHMTVRVTCDNHVTIAHISG